MKTLMVMLRDVTPGRNILVGLLIGLVLSVVTGAFMGVAALLSWATGVPIDVFIFGSTGVCILACWVASARSRASRVK